MTMAGTRIFQSPRLPAAGIALTEAADDDELDETANGTEPEAGGAPIAGAEPEAGVGGVVIT